MQSFFRFADLYQALLSVLGAETREVTRFLTLKGTQRPKQILTVQCGVCCERGNLMEMWECGAGQWGNLIQAARGLQDTVREWGQ